VLLKKPLLHEGLEHGLLSPCATTADVRGATNRIGSAAVSCSSMVEVPADSNLFNFPSITMYGKLETAATDLSAA